METPIILTDRDYARLTRMLETAGDDDSVFALEAEMARASIVPADRVPADVATLYSRVVIRDDVGKEREVVLVLPPQADARRNKVSVLSPLGTALLGLRAGQTIEWKVPRGSRRFEVLQVLYQPEAAGEDETL